VIQIVAVTQTVIQKKYQNVWTNQMNQTRFHFAQSIYRSSTPLFKLGQLLLQQLVVDYA
jgi:hypothetical protein